MHQSSYKQRCACERNCKRHRGSSSDAPKQSVHVKAFRLQAGLCHPPQPLHRFPAR